MITTLKSNEVFVFGSNLSGRHGAGAARQALEQFGAEYGVGEGLTGNCYAFPTLDRNLRKRRVKELRDSRDLFYKVCSENPDKTFLLTAVGTGLAGYPLNEMKQLFKKAPKNVVKPEEFR